MTYIRMNELDLSGKRVLIREDLNAPIKDGVITSTQRLDAALPTIRAARDAGAKVMLLAHRDRPKEGEFDAAQSLEPVADWLSDALDAPVRMVRQYLDGVDVDNGQVVLLENCRMNIGEKANDAELAKKYAALCDVFVMDAFGSAHRAQASTHGVIEQAPVAAAGPLLARELDALGAALDDPERPLLAIVAGSKVSTKLTALQALVERVDQLIVGGGIANTFIAACGHEVGHSLVEADLINAARKVMDAAAARGADVPIPTDVVVATEFSADASATVKAVNKVAHNEMILDIGPDTAARYAELIGKAGTVVWNGPVGVFEFDAFSGGTKAMAEAIAASDAYSIAGGGDTLAAVDKYGIADDVSYISTGGGAFLEFLEGKELPAVAALKARAAA